MEQASYTAVYEETSNQPRVKDHRIIIPIIWWVIVLVVVVVLFF